MYMFYIYICMCTCMCMCVGVCVHVCMCVCMCTCVCVCVYASQLAVNTNTHTRQNHRSLAGTKLCPRCYRVPLLTRDSLASIAWRSLRYWLPMLFLLHARVDATRTSLEMFVDGTNTVHTQLE